MWQKGASDFESAHNTARWFLVPKLRPHWDSGWPKTGHRLTVCEKQKGVDSLSWSRGACLILSVGGILAQALLLHSSCDIIFVGGQSCDTWNNPVVGFLQGAGLWTACK